MKSIEQIKAQREHEIKTINNFNEIICKTDNYIHIRSLSRARELHESRAELLDWVLDEGDFKKESQSFTNVEREEN